MTSPRLPAYPVVPSALPDEAVTAGRYQLGFARSAEELDEILRLRYAVFNLELGEGLEESHATGRDEDDLDRRFHHLWIRETRTGRVVGTYRMQTADMARDLGGYYSGEEFDLRTFPPGLLTRTVEIGRACVAREHRNGRVLHLLWRGLASYLAWNTKNLLFGCCSLTSQDPGLGIATHRHLAAQGHMHPSLLVPTQAEARCEVEGAAPLPDPHVPALFQSYLNLGAKVCSPPAIDRRFRTIDFLVLLDVDGLEGRVFRSFFR